MTDTTQPGADNALDLAKLDAIEAAARAVNALPDTIQPYVSQRVRVVVATHSLSGEQLDAVANFYDVANPAAVLALIALARRAAQPVEAEPVSLWDCRHPDDHAVLRFAAAMIRKMAVSREKGRHGWNNEGICPTERLQGMLLDHLAKGDPLDVANFCMMLWTRNAPVAATHPAEPIAYLVREQLLAGEWSEWETTTEEVYRFRTNRPRSNIQVKAVYDHPAVPAVGGALVASADEIDTLRNALIDLLLTEETALNAARGFEQQNDFHMRYARARWAISKFPFGGAAPAGALVAVTDEQQNSHVMPPFAAPVSQHNADSSKEWQPVTRAGQVKNGDKLRFTIGDQAYSERAKLILNPGTDKEEVIYDKGRNFYFITSMAISGKSSHKAVEVLASGFREGRNTQANSAESIPTKGNGDTDKGEGA